MKVYVASSMYDKDHTSYWMSQLRASGFEITCDWAQAMDEGRSLVASAEEDILGVLKADILWCQPSGHMSRGMWTEYGIALGQIESAPLGSKKQIVLSGPDDFRVGCVFAHYDHPNIHHFPTHELAFEYILMQPNWKTT